MIKKIHELIDRFETFTMVYLSIVMIRLVIEVIIKITNK
jgi:hypothetical protein